MCQKLLKIANGLLITCNIIGLILFLVYLTIFIGIMLGSNVNMTQTIVQNQFKISNYSQTQISDLDSVMNSLKDSWLKLVFLFVICSTYMHFSGIMYLILKLTSFSIQFVLMLFISIGFSLSYTLLANIYIQTLMNSTETFVQSLISNYEGLGGNSFKTVLVDYFQTQNQCCGFYGNTDYLNIKWNRQISFGNASYYLAYPLSCCNDTFLNSSSYCIRNISYSVGCKTTLWKKLYDNGTFFNSVSNHFVPLLIFELINAVLLVVLAIGKCSRNFNHKVYNKF